LKEAVFKLSEVRGDAQLRDLYSFNPALRSSLTLSEGIESRKKCLVHVLKHLGSEGIGLVGKLRELDHPNLLRVVDVVRDNDSVAVVYEHCQESVLDLVKKSGSLTPLFCLCIIKQVLAALRHCHDRQFTLRTLSLAQVLFLTSPCSSFVQIKVLPYDDEKTTDTIAPEATGKKTATPVSNLYSAGLILAQMLFGEADANATKNRLVRNSPRDWESVESQVKDFVLALTAPDRTKRLSLAECFSHPWISSWQHPRPPAAEEATFNALRNLASSKPMSPFKQTLLLFLCHQMYPEEAINEVQMAFQMLDVDMDGEVSGPEMQTFLLKRYSKPAVRGYFHAILRATGMPASGKIFFAEFLIRGCNRSVLVSHLALTPVFHMLDRKHSGRISVQRLKQVVRVGEEMDEAEEKVTWARAVAEVTKAEEGISFNDFCTYLRAA